MDINKEWKVCSHHKLLFVKLLINAFFTFYRVIFFFYNLIAERQNEANKTYFISKEKKVHK